MWFENYSEKVNNENNKNLISNYGVVGKNIKHYSIFSTWTAADGETWPSYYIFLTCVVYIIFTPFWLSSFMFNFQSFLCLLILISIGINLEALGNQIIWRTLLCLKQYVPGTKMPK
jgi:hypothetical protein